MLFNNFEILIPTFFLIFELNIRIYIFLIELN